MLGWRIYRLGGENRFEERTGLELRIGLGGENKFGTEDRFRRRV